MRIWGLLAFFGGFLVCQATFYIEFQRNGQRLYECSRPNLLRYYNSNAGIKVTCKPVANPSPDHWVYRDYNFYLVIKPALADGDYVVLTDTRGRETSERLPAAYMMGVLNSTPDHLIFFPTTSLALKDSRNKVKEMGFVVEENFKKDLINYIANPSAMLLQYEPDKAAAWLGAFVAFLDRLMRVLQMGSQANPSLKEPVGKAMRLAVNKMIDPCMVHFHPDAENWCRLYCRFLNVAAKFFEKVEYKHINGACNGLTRYCYCYQSPSFVRRLLFLSNGRPMQEFNALVRL